MEKYEEYIKQYSAKFHLKSALHQRRKPCWNCQGFDCVDPTKCLKPAVCGGCGKDHPTSICDKLAKAKLTCSFCFKNTHSVKDCYDFKQSLTYCQICEKYGTHEAFIDDKDNMVDNKPTRKINCPNFYGMTRKQREGPMFNPEKEEPVYNLNRGGGQARGRGGGNRGARGGFRGRGRGGAKGRGK